jgi:hypothetical protein
MEIVQMILSFLGIIVMLPFIVITIILVISAVIGLIKKDYQFLKKIFRIWKWNLLILIIVIVLYVIVNFIYLEMNPELLVE